MRVWLKEIRKSKNMTHDMIATECSITRQFYSMIENGNRSPSVKIAKAIAAALGFEWTLFFNELEDSNKRPNKRIAI